MSMHTLRSSVIRTPKPTYMHMNILCLLLAHTLYFIDQKLNSIFQGASGKPITLSSYSLVETWWMKFYYLRLPQKILRFFCAYERRRYASMILVNLWITLLSSVSHWTKYNKETKHPCIRRSCCSIIFSKHKLIISFPRRVITAFLFLQNESRKHIVSVNFEKHRAFHYHWKFIS